MKFVKHRPHCNDGLPFAVVNDEDVILATFRSGPDAVAFVNIDDVKLHITESQAHLSQLPSVARIELDDNTKAAILETRIRLDTAFKKLTP